MNSSIFSSDRSLSFLTGIRLPMGIPLIEDVRLQRAQVKAFVVKLALFSVLLVAFDRAGAEFLARGLERAYGLGTPATVLCIGHSHTALGIDETALEKELGVPVAKYARIGANVADRLVMIRQYLERQPSSVRILVYDVDAHIFTGKGLSLNSYTLFYPFMDSPSADAYVRRCTSFTDYHIRHLLKLRRFNLETCNAALRGWLRMYANLKSGTLNVERLKKEIAGGQIRHISFDDDGIKCFEETLRFVLGKGIHVVLLYIPTVDLYNQAEPAQYARAIQLLRDFSAQFERVTFLDYNPFLAHRYELFYDPVHLSPYGQQVVTKTLIHDLELILGSERNPGVYPTICPVTSCADKSSGLGE
jgi:hypothetical protein